jgi:hypothetical protein
VAVHPDVVYAVVEQDAKRYLKDLVAKVFKDKYMVVDEKKGKEQGHKPF